MAQITEANTVVVVVVVAVAESVDLCFLAHPSLLGLIVVVKGNSVMHHAELASTTSISGGKFMSLIAKQTCEE